MFTFISLFIGTVVAMQLVYEHIWMSLVEIESNIGHTTCTINPKYLFMLRFLSENVLKVCISASQKIKAQTTMTEPSIDRCFHKPKILRLCSLRYLRLR